MHIKPSTNCAISHSNNNLTTNTTDSPCLSYFPTKNLSSLSSDFQEKGHVGSCHGTVQPTVTLTIQALYS